MADCFEYADTMGRAVSKRWKACGNGLDRFPEIALGILQEFEPQHHLGISKVCSDVVRAGDRLPTQQRAGGARFGHPPLTLFNDTEGRFFIEMYLWSSMDMTIHDHPFTGAFTVLLGECRNDVFHFERMGGTDDFQLGTLEQQGEEMLSPGIGRPITNGRTLIHRNLHLSRPTVTFIIRTPWDGGTGLLYEEGGLAVNPALSNGGFKQLEFLEGLLRLDDIHGAERHLEQVITESPDPYLAYKALDLYLRKTHRFQATERFLSLFRPWSGGSWVPHLRDVFRCQANQLGRCEPGDAGATHPSPES